MSEAHHHLACTVRKGRWSWRLYGLGSALLLLAGLLFYLGIDVASLLVSDEARAAPPDSLDLSSLTIPRKEIHSGGPGKDGIPALSKPRFVKATAANFLTGADRIVGVATGKEATAYPIKILTWHEVVNDEVGKTPLAVTYCPLCDSVVAFDRRTRTGVREFGVSGLLYNSNVLLYDRSTKGHPLFSQMQGRGVSGAVAREPLTTVPAELTTWKAWKARYPDTLVLSIQTGYSRDYTANPYRDYFSDPRLMFPVRPGSDRLPVKALVLGVKTDKGARAYPLSALAATRGAIKEKVGGKQFTLEYDREARSVRVTEAEEGVEWTYAMWFAWYAFQPETEVFEVKKK